MNLYEYPCNERVRTFLRVECLFKRLFYFTDGTDANLHQVAVATLFDLIEVTERGDLRGMVLQDLERQRSSLAALREHPDVASDVLDTMLAEIQQISSDLAAQGRVAHELRNNEWLSNLRGRLNVAGGSSPVDMPSFYGWQQQPVARRHADLRHWATSLMPLYRALELVLRLLRGAGHAVPKEATEGAYQEMLGGKSFQLLRVWIDPSFDVFPEISANKYVILVRFVQHDADHRLVTIRKTIPFQLARCNIG